MDLDDRRHLRRVQPKLAQVAHPEVERRAVPGQPGHLAGAGAEGDALPTDPDPIDAALGRPETPGDQAPADQGQERRSQRETWPSEGRRRSHQRQPHEREAETQERRAEQDPEVDKATIFPPVLRIFRIDGVPLGRLGDRARRLRDRCPLHPAPGEG
jgi:hypothetical protein